MTLRKLNEQKIQELYDYMYKNKGMTKCEYARQFSLTCEELDLVSQGHTEYESYYAFRRRKEKGE